jgi:sensor domain CHASE-containing protein
VAERNKIQDEQKLLLIQSVSKLQKKLKISPTMEEKMLETENRAAVQPLDKPISVTKVAPVATVPTKSKVTASSDKKSLDRTDVLKDAINKFNKN